MPTLGICAAEASCLVKLLCMVIKEVIAAADHSLLLPLINALVICGSLITTFWSLMLFSWTSASQTSRPIRQRSAVLYRVARVFAQVARALLQFAHRIATDPQVDSHRGLAADKLDLVLLYLIQEVLILLTLRLVLV